MSSNTRIISDGAYNALKCLFDEYHEHTLEIEILPPAIAPPDKSFFIQEEFSVGIPKKVLVSAFLRAREVFAGRSQFLAEQDDHGVGKVISIVFSVSSDNFIGSRSCYYNYPPLRSGVPDSSKFPQGAATCNIIQ
jgi:hypothetical protein